MELFKHLGIEIEDGKEYTVEEQSDLLIGTLKARLQEDEDFIKAIPAEKLPKIDIKEDVAKAMAEHYGKANKAIISTLGLTTDELNKIPEADRKDVWKLIKHGTDIYKQRVGASPSSEQMEQILQEKLSLEETLEKIKKDNEELEPKLRTAIQSEFDAKLMELNARTVLSQMQDNLPANSKLLFDGLYNAIKSKYDLRNDNGEIVIYKKGTEFKVENKGTNKFMVLADAFKAELGDNFIDKKEPATPIKVPITPNATTAGGGSISLVEQAYLKKIQSEQQ